MDAGSIERIEISIERGAALLFAAAVAFAAFALPRGALPQPQLGACAALAAVAAYLLSSRVMTAASAQKPAYRLQVFDVREIEREEADELLLTEADRLSDELVLSDADRLPPVATLEEPLLLEDALPPSKSDARVVRLFDRTAMPTPGQLKSQIDDHLAGAKPVPPQSDASKALAEALAELRRSLR